ncbi:sialate O-acetylesterase [Dyadobacter luticola]|uniref:Sialate O-acetylesterase n=2 Tax=Dyadobacter luticola TaxID=1979387 RepID=A0A5R9KZP9_9BACT|nr:sialate O-acetylesterase [Dyadobacter luticola]
MLLTSVFFSSHIFAQNVPAKMDLYLLIGQSNMAGRGKVDSLSIPKNPEIWFLDRNVEWKMAADPLHFDKPAVVGVGPGLAFAQEIAARRPEMPVGLIPCAVGGSSIDDWQPGVRHAQTGIYAWDEMLERVKAAMKNGKIKGVIWHQGESDSTPEKKKEYEAKLEAFFKRLRSELDLKKTPIILGTIGDFYVAKHPDAVEINKAMHHYAASHKNTYVISSTGLTDMGDETHFDTASARELGRRYASKYLSVSKKK